LGSLVENLSGIGAELLLGMDVVTQLGSVQIGINGKSPKFGGDGGEAITGTDKLRQKIRNEAQIEAESATSGEDQHQ